MSTVAQAIADSEKEISPAVAGGYVPAKAILAFVAVCAIAKLLGAWATGFAGDESYTVVISRTLALSYFDHPPLHQWIVHAFGALAGEGWWLRLPFILMIAATNVPLYGLTRCLFGRDAAIWALFGFNATAYFIVWPDGYIMPDVPLFLFLTTAIWAVAEILFGPRRGSGGYVLLWLAAGLAFGLAGLSKYSAIFAPMGLFGYLLFSPRHRSWLWRPQPYLGAAVALAIFAPALIWNHQNHWVSFAFQSGRAGRGLHFDAVGFTHAAQALSSQIALISPWVGIPLVLALADALRSRDPESGQRFLLSLIHI
jgi:4-amino-4-deoxy-L-arabinose transferase-like glycosyltransferase